MTLINTLKDSKDYVEEEQDATLIKLLRGAKDDKRIFIPIAKPKKKPRGMRINAEPLDIERVRPKRKKYKRKEPTYTKFDIFGPLMILEKSRKDKYKVWCMDCKDEYLITVKDLRWYRCTSCKAQRSHRPTIFTE
jgi:hypothetical protein